jgi:ABC-type branched-subunit amino acid transport system ATPase component
MVAQNRARRLKRQERRAAATGLADLSVARVGALTEVDAMNGGEAAIAQVRAPTHSGAEVSDQQVALGVRGVVAGYGEIEVLHGIDLRLAAGSITVLLGANGAGKSTLCSALAGTMKCIEGTITVSGNDVTHLTSHKRVGQGLSLVPEGRGVFPGLSVEENLTVWLPDHSDRESVFEQFPQLASRRTQVGWNLSGGEQQLLSLAPMIVRPPRVLVADEPTLGLAPLAVRLVLDLFARLREEGVCVLLVEEKAHVVLEVADQAALLELGRVTWVGEPKDLDPSMLADAYLGVAE